MPHGNTVKSLHIRGNNFLQAGERGTIAFSSNGGNNFFLLVSPTDKDIQDAFIVDFDRVFAVGLDGGYLSTNNGSSWTQTLSGTPPLFAGIHVQNDIYVGGNLGYIGKSTDGGISFITVHNNPITDILDFAAPNPSSIFAAGTFGRILHSSNGGSSWEFFNSGTSNVITSIDFFNSQAGAASSLNSILTTSNGGQSWTLTTPGPNVNFNAVGMFSANGIVAVGNNSYVARTSNFGLNWAVSQLTSGVNFESLVIISDTQYVGGQYNTNFKSTNAGQNWSEYGTFGRVTVERIKAFVRLLPGEPLGNPFQPEDTIFCTGDTGLVIKTTNSGQNWQTLNTGTTLDMYAGTFLNGSTGFVVGGRSTTGIMLKTTNGGINWTQLNPLNDLTRNIYFINDLTGIVCGAAGKVARTTNGGASWSMTPTGFSSALHSIDFTDENTGVICGAFGNLARTTNAGASWEQISGLTGTMLSVSFTDMNTGVTVGSSGRMYRTTNAGINWTLLPSITLNVLNGVQMIGDLGFACGTNLGNDASIIKSTDRGQSWFRTNSSTNNQLNGIFFINPTTGFAVGERGTILKTTNGGTPIGITQINSEVPKNYSLGQNYPNPFNPQTKIRFQLPGSSHVKLEVYDLLGRLIELLAEGNYKAGIYEADWNASNYSSGVYFYKLVTDNLTETKKMVLIK